MHRVHTHAALALWTATLLCATACEKRTVPGPTAEMTEAARTKNPTPEQIELLFQASLQYEGPEGICAAAEAVADAYNNAGNDAKTDEWDKIAEERCATVDLDQPPPLVQPPAQ